MIARSQNMLISPMLVDFNVRIGHADLHSMLLVGRHSHISYCCSLCFLAWRRLPVPSSAANAAGGTRTHKRLILSQDDMPILYCGKAVLCLCIFSPPERLHAYMLR